MTAPSAGWFEGREHRLAVRVYYEDTDFTGLVYHANYLRFFERGRSDFLRLAGVDHATLLAHETPMAFAVSELNIRYFKPARIDDALVVVTEFDALRGARVAITQRLVRDGTLLAEAGVEVACIGADGRPRKPPIMLKERLLPYLSPVG